MQAVDLAETNMKGVSLYDCDLADATFERTDLTQADLRGAKNYIIDPDINKLKNARFSIPEVLGLLAKYSIKIE